jgi:membrane protein insertase Oxa1/YidC/SpoIIIJ
MAVGNFINTVQTLLAKSRFKKKMKRTKSKQDAAEKTD